MNSKLPDSHIIVVQSDPSEVPRICEQILGEVKANNFSDEDSFAVHLALEESVVNAMKHGNKMDQSKKVQIEYSVDKNKIEVFITDEGEGFNPHKIPDPRSGENLYRPEGRGLLLMNSYMDVVEYNETGNTVHLVRYKEKPSVNISKKI